MKPGHLCTVEVDLAADGFLQRLSLAERAT